MAQPSPLPGNPHTGALKAGCPQQGSHPGLAPHTPCPETMSPDTAHQGSETQPLTCTGVPIPVSLRTHEGWENLSPDVGQGLQPQGMGSHATCCVSRAGSLRYCPQVLGTAGVASVSRMKQRDDVTRDSLATGSGVLSQALKRSRHPSQEGRTHTPAACRGVVPVGAASRVHQQCTQSICQLDRY